MTATLTKHYGPGNHANGTPQTTHGRWARNASATDITEDTLEQSGATVAPPTGNRPSKGFSVAVQGREYDKVTPDIVRDFIADNWDYLARPGHYLGTWVNPENNKVWLDVSRVIDSDNYDQAFERAVRFGRSTDQIAIYDLLSGTEINLDDESVEAYRSAA